MTTEYHLTNIVPVGKSYDEETLGGDSIFLMGGDT